MPAGRSDRRARAARRILEHLARAVEVPLSVRLWDGTSIPLADGAPTDQCITIAGPGVLGALLRRPTLDTLFRLYVQGRIALEGADLLATFELAQRKKKERIRLADLRRGFPWTAVLPLLLARADRAEIDHAVEGAESGRARAGRSDAEMVQFHYDVGNDFYRLFLDDEMVYSCAYFTDWTNRLDRAQVDKLELICRKLRLRPDETFLDIGCGWGALVCHAARHHGVRAHGVTLSQAQHDEALAKVRRLGLADRVTIELRDYTTLAGRYDKIASIGMYEHVGIANYPTYFRKMNQLLADGGIFLNHGITRRAKRNPANIGKISPSKRVILKYIFPGSELDHIGHTVQAMESAGFEVHDVEGLRLHYALTTRLWYERLTARRSEAIALVGAQRYRMWVAYLAGVSAAFERGPLRIYQTVATRPVARAAPPLPPTRDDIYREGPHPSAPQDASSREASSWPRQAAKPAS